MRIYVIGFAAGVWWLQMQEQLPALHWYWLAAPLAVAGLLIVARSRWLHIVRRALVTAGFCACGFLWAAWLAGQRLAGALPAHWEGADIRIVGVVAALPQPYERSLRFEFDVERVLTPQAVAPEHIALTWWGSPERADKPATFPELHVGERWQLTARLRQPHGTLNPHGFDYEAWLLERGIRASGYIRPATGASMHWSRGRNISSSACAKRFELASRPLSWVSRTPACWRRSRSATSARFRSRNGRSSRAPASIIW